MPTPLQFLLETFRLEFVHPFGLSHSSRTYTDTLFAKITWNGITGTGEAALPPYLGYNAQQLQQSKLPEELLHCNIPEEAIRILDSSLLPAPLKCAIDCALYDAWSKVENIPIYKLLELPDPGAQVTCYTLAIGSNDEMKEKIQSASQFKLFKIKLGSENDRDRIEYFRKLSDKDFCVDINQGWNSVDQAFNELQFLKSMGCIFVEQPFPVLNPELQTELIINSPLPLFLDESIQNEKDFDRLYTSCDGINIKLVKCGGLTPAARLLNKAISYNKRILVGCMSESSCGAVSAYNLCAKADFADLDGPLLIKNDPFDKVKYQDGRITLK